jgi:hypothetical protein
MFDPPSVQSPPWHFKGQGWIFLLSCADSNATTDGAAPPVCGPASLSLYRYTESPFGAYDELSYSPGWYEYATSRHPEKRSKARRVTRSFVSCRDRDLTALRQHLGIPVVPARFRWHVVGPTEFCVQVIPSPGNAMVVDLNIALVSCPTVTTNTRSILCSALDFGRLAPIVQPLLDGKRVSIPESIDPWSPLLESAPMIKSYASVGGSTTLVQVTRIVMNKSILPSHRSIKMSKLGVAFTEMEMTISEPEIVLDVVPSEPRTRSAIYAAISSWLKAISFKSVPK